MTWRELERQAHVQGLTRPVRWDHYHVRQAEPVRSPMSRNQSGKKSTFGRLYLRVWRKGAA